jgi:hypothetical protein
MRRKINKKKTVKVNVNQMIILMKTIVKKINKNMSKILKIIKTRKNKLMKMMKKKLLFQILKTEEEEAIKMKM